MLKIEFIEMYPPPLFLRFAIGVDFTVDDLVAALSNALLSEQALRQYPLVVMDLRTIHWLHATHAAFLLALSTRVYEATTKPLGVILQDMTSVALLVRDYLRLFTAFPEYPDIAAAQASVQPPNGS